MLALDNKLFLAGHQKKQKDSQGCAVYSIGTMSEWDAFKLSEGTTAHFLLTLFLE